MFPSLILMGKIIELFFSLFQQLIMEIQLDLQPIQLLELLDQPHQILELAPLALQMQTVAQQFQEDLRVEMEDLKLKLFTLALADILLIQTLSFAI